MTLRAEVHGPLAFPDGGSGDTVQPIAGAQLTFKCITGTDGGAFVGSSDITAEQKIVTDANGNFSIWLPLTTETIPTGTPRMQNTREATGKARSL